MNNLEIEYKALDPIAVKHLVRTLTNTLEASRNLWNEGKEPAYIVGYLQGGVDTALKMIDTGQNL